jgi:superfamily I DNA/RNA helicase
MTRSLVWEIYEEYRASCDEASPPVADWDWLLRKALDAIEEEPPSDRYSAIVVDEAQDITEVGMRLLLGMLDGGRDGRILVIGDSGQRIYPGGYRLADLGLEIRGRSFPMSVCYRSTDEIMQVVGAIGKFVSTEEFGEDGLRSFATATVRSGERPGLWVFNERNDEIAWLIDRLDPDDPAIDGTAILVYSNRAVDEWRKRLADAGIGTVGLDEYRGRGAPGVKIGTYNRAKGLEFEHVYVPGLNAGFPFVASDDPDELIEKGSLLYVALSRARDRLAISYAGRPSMFIEPAIPFLREMTRGQDDSE